MQGRPLRFCLWLRREREALDQQSYGLQRECHCVKVLERGLGQVTNSQQRSAVLTGRVKRA